VEQAELQVNNSQLRAPFDGVVVHRSTNVGDFVGGDRRPEALFVVARLDSLRVQFRVPEANANQVRVGDPILVQCQAVDREVKAKMSRLAPLLDGTQPSLLVEADIPAQAAPRLFPGMVCRALVEVQSGPGWTIPAGAVQLSSNGKEGLCYLAVNGKAVRTAVQVGIRGESAVQVLKRKPASMGMLAPWQDFTGAEKVIVEPKPGQLKDDLPVRAVPVKGDQ
jgi:membrane fusion protein (multidrug efflux system)